jgi:UDP-N-acetylglucosamine 2-epimerase (non-hydrolysing)
MTDKSWTLLCVVGARPNFMKIAPIVAALRDGPIDARIIHTGQHYDAELSTSFFEQLSIPAPYRHLGVGSGSHAAQTAEIMKRFEAVLDEEPVDGVLVVGDVNSTIAAAMVATKKKIPVIHVEAGLRSGDRGMPEEINRLLTDQISDVLYTTEREAAINLAREGIPDSAIVFAGNVMVDTLRMNLPRATPPHETIAKANNHAIALDNGYGLLTLHRPSNVDGRGVFKSLLETVASVAESLPLVFPVHPRTKTRIEEFGLGQLLKQAAIICAPPLSYLEMAGIIASAKLVLTDSGGIQEETTALGIPCLTLRENTERPITVSEGTNILVGRDPKAILREAFKVLQTGGKRGIVPEYWDGNAARRIADDLVKRLRNNQLHRA